jgi:hypothetical protein
VPDRIKDLVLDTANKTDQEPAFTFGVVDWKHSVQFHKSSRNPNLNIQPPVAQRKDRTCPLRGHRRRYLFLGSETELLHYLSKIRLRRAVQVERYFELFCR